MNSFGGTLVVGVDDAGEIVGIEEDSHFSRNLTATAGELWLTDAVSHSLGKAAAAELEVRIAKVDGKFVARVDTGPAAPPGLRHPARRQR